MEFYSTNNPAYRVDLREAVLSGLPPDNGLFMPGKLEPMPAAFFEQLRSFSFADVAVEVAVHLLGTSIPRTVLEPLVRDAINFEAPLVRLGQTDQYILELFHGPTLAFKDFGARFMARLMGHFVKDSKRELVILVATSGDTGGAVARGFFQTPGIRVVVLYPEGKVSAYQEKQIAALGSNIHAYRVAGTFDDCQALVKQSFLDEELREQIWLTSANSINISRLIPQSFYFFRAIQQLPLGSADPVFVVPSGNFGNLTAGLLAQRLGLKVAHFVAATNANDIVPEYLASGVYQPRPSVATLSNAMDVGNPSNFARMLELFHQNQAEMAASISGHAVSDDQTRECIHYLWSKFGYLADPHTAVGFLAAQNVANSWSAHPKIILSTAHPAKFPESVEDVTHLPVELPPALAELKELSVQSKPIGADFGAFRQELVHLFG